MVQLNAVGSPGSENGARTQGFPRNLGGPTASVREDGSAERGNEARGDRRLGFRAAHSTAEAGEPTQGTPWKEGAAGTRN